MVPDLREVETLPQLVAYLRDEMGWPIERGSFEDQDDLFFEYVPEELGIDNKNAAKIQTIRRLRPLSVDQPWGIFFVQFEPKHLPVVALRRILSGVALKKRESANSAERAAWSVDDLLFASNYGEGERRQISLAHFSCNEEKKDLPTLKVLGWDNLDTSLRLDHVADRLTERLAWPENEKDRAGWRKQWHSAFTLEHREVINTSKKLSVELAKLARDIRDRINDVLAIETQDGPVSQMMAEVKKALIHDLDQDGFADMYAQTIAYGLLSARITNPSSVIADDLAGAMPVTNPFLKELMETFLKVGGRKGKAGSGGLDFDELGVSEVVELLDHTNMEEVLLDFGDLNPQEDPVIHFFEGFLQEYDKKIRKDRGVFYTPRPVVSFIVRSVDELLRTEFGLDDGLADMTTWGEMSERIDDLEIPEGATSDQDFVQILDPATGTGTFLVEVIGLVHQTMTEKWQAEGHGVKKIEQLWNDYVPQHLLPRLHGYELMMAPYAIAHMKIGLKLYETGYRFESDERARVYLTNSLEPPQDFSGTFAFAIPALAHEAKAVNAIKRDQRFTVVIGNPPYSGLSANMTRSAKRLVDAYKFVDGSPLDERKLWLQDDYVKFMRSAQVTLERVPMAVFSFITNHGYLENPTFRGMRQSLISTYRQLRLLDLHGNTRKKERGPGGSEDVNVFDISQGVAVCMAVRGAIDSLIIHKDLWGSRSDKYDWLSQNSVRTEDWPELKPDSPFYLLSPQDTVHRTEYDTGWTIEEIFRAQGVGVVMARDSMTVDFDRGSLWNRIIDFVSLDVEEAREKYELGKDARDWKVMTAQADLRQSGPRKGKITQILYRPFDRRFTYYTGTSRGFYASPCRRVMQHMLDSENLGLVITRRVELGHFEHVFCTDSLIGHHSMSAKEVNYICPLWVKSSKVQTELIGSDPYSRSNFRPEFVTELAEAVQLSRTDELSAEIPPTALFYYIYAVLHSPTYRSRYSAFLKNDYPRIPLPATLDVLQALCDHGQELVSYHLLRSPKPDRLITNYNGPRNPEVGRVGWSDGTVWIDAGKTNARQGHRATKPGTIGFRGVPEDVWDFHIGGYQVCHKWLKDRRGRTLSEDDIAHYQKIVVALSETIRIMGEIDGVIEEHGGWPGAFHSEPSEESPSGKAN